jgi:hypothetical protein
MNYIPNLGTKTTVLGQLDEWGLITDVALDIPAGADIPKGVFSSRFRYDLKGVPVSHFEEDVLYQVENITGQKMPYVRISLIGIPGRMQINTKYVFNQTEHEPALRRHNHRVIFSRLYDFPPESFKLGDVSSLRQLTVSPRMRQHGRWHPSNVFGNNPDAFLNMHFEVTGLGARYFDVSADLNEEKGRIIEVSGPYKARGGPGEYAYVEGIPGRWDQKRFFDYVDRKYKNFIGRHA